MRARWGPDQATTYQALMSEGPLGPTDHHYRPCASESLGGVPTFRGLVVFIWLQT